VGQWGHMLVVLWVLEQVYLMIMIGTTVGGVLGGYVGYNHGGFQDALTGVATGGYLGGALGSMAGAAAGRRFGRMVGLGDYAIQGIPETNQIIKGSRRPPLQVNGTEDLSGDIVIAKREMIGNIAVVNTTGAAIVTGFQSQSYGINPGLAESFPWISQVAQNFSLWRAEGLAFEYRPTSGDYGSANSNSLGKVIFATQYDPDANAFGSSIEMENYDYASSVKPSAQMVHGVETKRAQGTQNMYYVRTGVSQKDKAFTDSGTLQVATEGVFVAANSTAIIGELWVTYKFRFSRSLLFGSILNRDVKQDAFFAQNLTITGSLFDNSTNGVAAIPLFSTRYGAALGATVACAKLTNTVGGVLSSNNSTNINYVFPASIDRGQYWVMGYIDYTGNQTSTGLFNPGISFGTIGVQDGNGTIPGVSQGGAGINAASNDKMVGFTPVVVDAPGPLQCTLVYTVNAPIAAGSKYYFYVIEAPIDMFN
jgi:hypothetical protein